MNNEINYVSPFKRFCISIGNLPTAYLESMSYYETLCWLCKYLENTINPAINQNADIVSCKTIQHNDYGLHKIVKKGATYVAIDFYNFINNKLIKRDIWSKTHYSPLRFREDINTLFRCLEYSNNTIQIDYAGYHYNLRPNSLTSTPNIAGKSYIYNCLAIIENLEFFKERNIEPKGVCKSQYNIMRYYVPIGKAVRGCALTVNLIWSL